MSVPVRWPGKTFFYAVGNTPAVNLTQSLPPEGDANILLLGCGDPRNIIYTLFGESKRSRKLDFTCCDAEPAVLARNVILLTLVMDGHPINHIWNVFYHYNLDDDSLALLIKQCNILLSISSDLHAWRDSPYFPHIQFSSSHTLALLRRHWQLYISFPSLPKAKHVAFRDAMRQMFDKQAIPSNFSAALAAGMSALEAMNVANENFHLYRKTGVVHPVTSIQKAAIHINPTFVYSLLGDACVFHYATYPLQGFHIGEAFALSESVMQKELVDCAMGQFKKWCTAWKESLPKATVRFIAGDAIAVCRTIWNKALTGSNTASLYVSPWAGAELSLDGGDMPTSFSIIDTSNLMDYLGTLNILVATAPLLSPDPSSTLQTEALIGIGNDPVQGFVKRLCADIPTFASLLGIAPIGYLAGFHSESNIHEIMIARNYPGSTFPIGPQGYHERISWKLLPPVFPSVEPKKFALLMYNIYVEIFGSYEDPRVMADAKRMKDRGMISGVLYYHRHTIVVLLSFLKGRFHILDGDWSESMNAFLYLLQLNKGLVFGTNFYQEICGLMHIHGVHSIGVYKAPQPIFGNVFGEWSAVPPVVCVVLVFPKSAPGMRKLCAMHPDELGSVMLEMGVRSTNAHNMFSAIQIIYGTARAIGQGQDKRVEIEEDEGGWASSGPNASVIVSAWVSSLSLMAIHAPPAKVIFNIHQSIGTSAQQLPLKFGTFLAIHEESLLNRNTVHIVANRPGRPNELEVLQRSAPQSPPTAPHMAVMNLDAECKSLKDMTIREMITDEEELRTLQSGAKVEVVHTTGLCNAMAEFGNHSKLFTFPLPVDSVSARLKIARKSGYLELVSPPIVPGASRQVAYVTLAPVPNDLSPVCWNIHRVDLSNCPTYKHGKRKVDLIQTQCSLAMSDRERAIRERGYGSGLVGAPEQLAVLNVKDTMHSLIGRANQLQDAKYRIFSLTDDARGGIYASILINRLCLDLSSHTIVADCNVVVFERKTVQQVAPILHNRGNQDQTIQAQIKTSGDETLAWLHLLPAFVERCRTWSHKPTCEYKKLRKIPVSSTYGEMPLCRCGLGQDLGNFFEHDNMAELKQCATRAAISPLYAVSYLDLVGDTPPQKSSASKTPSSNSCARCGAAAKEGEPLKSCGRCKKAKYCGGACQKADWDTHKHFCRANSKP